MYDIIVVGGGCAGISAAIYAKSRGKKVLVIEKKMIGGLISGVSSVTHFSPLFKNESGKSFSDRLKKQAENCNLEIIYENVIQFNLDGQVKTLKTETNTYTSSKVILANGTSPRKLGIVGEDKFLGLNPSRDCEKFRGKNIYLIGGADGAIKEALFLANYAKKLTIIHFEDKLNCIQEFKDRLNKLDNIDYLFSYRLNGIYGEEQVEFLELKNETDGSIIKIEDKGAGVFVYAGSTPNTNFLADIKLENGYIVTDECMESSIKGVYAAGDIRSKSVRQLATAISDGCIAAISASK